ncbi:MAG: zinc ribbon domain-containing protein [Syntrophobacteraceae bacterium]|nr:zinc ribbon domain-containing protein [Syntrophobacteraceae bacterium]
MPIFEFQCTSCGNVFEKIVSAGSPDLRCEKCGCPDLKRLLSTPSSLSGVKSVDRLPGAGDTGCCGASAASKGCVPGSCCGKALS